MFESLSKKSNQTKSRPITSSEAGVMTYHYRRVGSKYVLERRFQLSCIRKMSTFHTFEDISKIWFILKFVNKFLTEEARYSNSISDDEMIDFFSYAYRSFYDECHSLYQENVEEWIKSMLEYNPRVFSDKAFSNGYKNEVNLLYKEMLDNGLDVEVKES